MLGDVAPTARDRLFSRTPSLAQISAEALDLHRRGQRPIALRHQSALTQEPLERADDRTGFPVAWQEVVVGRLEILLSQLGQRGDAATP
jgi:hypothetical protein